ncbi:MULTISPECIES: HAD hydrolase-like protein [unclassified Diaminobutyricimonas]|uniref:HAD hydrolase-like protein n=1 Tax=unclassified Diaminobutyricimonas TaxID=2643261 RepID=UPI0012F52600|nr:MULTISPECIES: HAD hydrolase-like protein [unclassified Diaminobutyricimonas]
MYSCILLDLDGTITDSAPGIISTLKWTLEQIGQPVPPAEDLLKWVGPPIMDSFRDFAGLNLEQANEALAVYRAKYLDDGAYDSTLFPGMPALIRDIHRRGIPFSLATSKPELPATLMLEHFDLANHFTVITGASADETRSEKADVIAEALVRLESVGADVSNPVMVGDRIHDVEGAAAHGIPTIGVDWGYGSPEEFADAIAVVSTPAELAELLFAEQEEKAVVN